MILSKSARTVRDEALLDLRQPTIYKQTEMADGDVVEETTDAENDPSKNTPQIAGYARLY